MKLVMRKLPKGTKVECLVYDKDTIVDSVSVDPSGPRSRLRIVKHGIPDSTLVALLYKVTVDTPIEYEILEPDTAADEPVYALIRKLDEPRETGERVDGADAILARIPSIPVDYVIEIKGDEVGCLDVDYHESSPPNRSLIEAWVQTRLSPKPILWHFSRGGGVHAFYRSVDNLTGAELAAAAAIHYAAIDPSCSVELKFVLRGPGEAECFTRALQHKPDAIWLGGNHTSTDETEDAFNWLEANGMQLNVRYPHEKCPISPSTDSGKHRDPVIPLEGGVYCHLCKANGNRLGSRAAGWASWAALTGNSAVSEIGRMIQNRVHWGHARWTLTHKYHLDADLAKKAYSAALKLAGCPADLAAQAFHRDTSGFARSSNAWFDVEAGYLFPDGKCSDLIRALPVTLALNEKDQWRPVASTVNKLSHGIPLDDYGYSSLKIIHGHRLGEQFLPMRPETMVPVCVAELRDRNYAPHYIPKDKRKHDIGWAEAKLEELFPKIDWPLVRAIICAAGCAQETRLGQHPFIFIAGCSGTAKSTTPEVAYGILGSGVSKSTFNSDERFRQSIKEGGRTAAFTVCDEFLKDAARFYRKWDPRTALELLLNTAPGVKVHEMYVGARPLIDVPAIILTEPACPYEIRDYVQVSRRLRYYHLYNRKDWDKTLPKHGITKVHLFRLAGAEFAEAADIILSDVIDQDFSYPTPWDDLADKYGVRKIEDSPDFPDKDDEMMRLFNLVCTAPVITDPRLKRLYGETYKQIDRNATDDLARDLTDCYTIFSNSSEWTRSSLLEEKDWSGLLKTALHVRVELIASGNSTVFIRFFVGPSKKPTYTNGQILEAIK